jgi:hypothetical protein
MLDWHITFWGTVNTGSKKRNNPWKIYIFVEAIHIGVDDPRSLENTDRKLQNWRFDKHPISNKDQLVRILDVLFGNKRSLSDWRKDLSEAHELRRKRGNSTAQPAQTAITNVIASTPIMPLVINDKGARAEYGWKQEQTDGNGWKRNHLPVSATKTNPHGYPHRGTYADLLCWHMDYWGTRPTGSTATNGIPWRTKEFVYDEAFWSGGDRDTIRVALRNWRGEGRRCAPSDLYAQSIQRALFGKNIEFTKWINDFEVARIQSKGANNNRRTIIFPDPPPPFSVRGGGYGETAQSPSVSEVGIYPSDATYGELLKWHLYTYGTRPDGDRSRLGQPWKNREFAERVFEHHAHPDAARKSLHNWLQQRHFPSSARATLIENALFGDNAEFDVWKADLRVAWCEARRIKSGASDVSLVSSVALPVPYGGTMEPVSSNRLRSGTTMAIEPERARFGISLGYALARLEFVENAILNEVKLAEINIKNEIHELLLVEKDSDLTANLSGDAKNMTQHVLRFYEIRDIKVHGAILIGIGSQRLGLYGAYKSPEQNEEIKAIALSAFMAIDHHVISDPQALFHKLLEIKNISIPEICRILVL